MSTLIARDTSAGPAIDAGSGSTSITLASYILSSDNPTLIVGVENDDNSLSTVTGVVFNSIAMTQIGAASSVFGASTTLTLWYGTGAVIGSGTHNIVASRNGSPVNHMRMIAASYTGTDQASQPDPSGYGDAYGDKNATITASRTTTFNNDWTVVYAYADSGNAITAGTGSTSFAVGGNGGIFDSNGAQTPAGSYSMSVGIPNSGNPFNPQGGMLMIGLKNATPTSTASFGSSRMLLGVGT